MLWSNGHLAWPLFAALVYVGLYWLTVDIAWRLITLPARAFALMAFGLGAVGPLLLVALAY